MLRASWAVAFVLPLLILSGCSSSPGDAPVGTATPTNVQTVLGDQPAPPPPPPVVAPCQVTRTAANTALGYGVNPDAVLDRKVSCPFSEASGGNLSRFTYAVVEVAWQAQTTETSIGVRVNAPCRGDDQPATPGQSCVLGQAVAQSTPLRVVLLPDVMFRNADTDPQAYIFTEGASVEHAFDVRISLFEKGPVPDGYTGFTLLL